MPAFMRPRKPTEPEEFHLYITISFTAYGAYNDIVRQVSGIRGQTIANWDFEYVLIAFQPI